MWQAVEVTVYGCQRTLWAFAYEVVWPRVLGLRPVRVVVVRDPEGSMDDIYLFSTDVQADLGWVISRWSQPEARYTANVHSTESSSCRCGYNRWVSCPTRYRWNASQSPLRYSLRTSSMAWAPSLVQCIPARSRRSLT